MNVLQSDGDLHRRLRATVTKPLTPARLSRARDDFKAMVAGRIDALVGQGWFDAMRQLASFLPVEAVSHLVGLPEDGRERMLEWAGAAFNVIGPRQDPADVASMRDAFAFLSTLGPDRLREGSWAAELLAAAQGGRLSMQEAMAAISAYVIPSLDTTILAKGHLLNNLAIHPDQWALLKERPELIPAAVLEGVRHSSVLRWFSRVAACDYPAGDAVIPAGQRVMLLYGCANRDERHYKDPDRFDITRDARDHLAWGTGPHMCAGMNLARVEMEVMLEALVKRDARLSVGDPVIVDPRDDAKTANMTIVIKMGRITDIFPAGSKAVSSDAEIVDGTGKFVVPGYNDMHSHVLELGDPSGSLALMLAEGVTGFRQMSGSPALLAARRAGKLPIGREAPALHETPGSLITPFNGGSAEAVAAEIRRQKAQGADFIKVGLVAPDVFFAAIEEANALGIGVLGHLQEGTDASKATAAGFRSVEHLGPGSTVWICCSSDEAQLRADSYRREFIKAPPFKIPFLETLVMKRLGKMLINPSAFAQPADVSRLKRAIDTYSDEKGQSVAEQFRADGSWHVPTLLRLRTQEYADRPEYESDEMLRYMPERAVGNWRQVTARYKALPADMLGAFCDAYPRQLELTKLLSDAGVRMMAGTDGGSYLGPGLMLKQEFRELADAGLSPLKILHMATVNAAEYLRKTDTMGLVAIGYDADLVVLDADPLARVENLHAIAAVLRGGTHYSANALEALKQRIAQTRGTLH